MKKIAVITGGSSGLGFAFAKHLGQEGYSIVIIARDQEKIDISVKKLKEMNIDSKGYSCDVSDEQELKNTVSKIKEEFENIEFLILAAGIVTVKLLNQYKDTKELKKDLEIDLWGTIQSAYFFENLLKRNSKVLFISSGFGLMGAAGYSMYCAAKAGVINFAESWRRELLNKGINVYVAAPGDVDTPQYRGEIASHPDWMKKDTPRKLDTPEKVSKIILKQCKGKRKFLILPASDVKFLNFMSKILPRKLRDMLLDSIFPKPNF